MATVAITEELRDSECLVCLDTMHKPVQLPCSHAICSNCLKQLKGWGGTKALCPMCRAPLPPGPEAIYTEGCLLSVRASQTGSAAAKHNLQCRALELFDAAAAQGHDNARFMKGTTQNDINEFSG